MSLSFVIIAGGMLAIMAAATSSFLQQTSNLTATSNDLADLMVVKDHVRKGISCAATVAQSADPVLEGRHLRKADGTLLFAGGAAGQWQLRAFPAPSLPISRSNRGWREVASARHRWRARTGFHSSPVLRVRVLPGANRFRGRVGLPNAALPRPRRSLTGRTIV